MRIRLLRSRSFAVTGVRRGAERGMEKKGRTGSDVDTVLLDAVDDTLDPVS